MATHYDQIQHLNDWFGTWSELQKEDFVAILAQKIKPNQYINGLVNGLQNLNCSSRPPSLFSCQIKLFTEWWEGWNEEDRENFKAKLRQTDAKFWVEVEGELDGTRKKLNEDFFLVSNNVTVTSETPAVPPQPTTTTTAEEVTIVDNNGLGDVTITPTITKEKETNGHSETVLSGNILSINIPGGEREIAFVTVDGEGDV